MPRLRTERNGADDERANGSAKKGSASMNANGQVAYLGYQIDISQDKARFTARISR